MPYYMETYLRPFSHAYIKCIETGDLGQGKYVYKLIVDYLFNLLDSNLITTIDVTNALIELTLIK